MASNQLMLNPSKSEFLWCSSPRRVLLLDQSAFVLWDGSIKVSSVMRNLGAFFDVTMSMNDHINRLVWSSYYQLRQIKSIRHALPTSTAIQLVNSFIISWVDYCNSILATYRSINSTGCSLFWTWQRDWFSVTANMTISHHFWETDYAGFRLLTVLISSDYWWSGKRCMVSPQATSRTIVSKSRQISGDRVYVLQVTVLPSSQTIKFGESSFGICGPITWNSLPDCKRRWLHRSVQVETKNLLIWIIVWLALILQLCCKCALVLRTVRAYGLRHNINYHNNNYNNKDAPFYLLLLIIKFSLSQIDFKSVRQRPVTNILYIVLFVAVEYSFQIKSKYV